MKKHFCKNSSNTNYFQEYLYFLIDLFCWYIIWLNQYDILLVSGKLLLSLILSVMYNLGLVLSAFLFLDFWLKGQKKYFFKSVTAFVRMSFHMKLIYQK